MNSITANDLKLCILGGGQLGKMLIESAGKWNIKCYVLDPDAECSCAHIAYQFECGDLRDFETVYKFCRYADKITIEIEHVNTDALIQLKKEGKKIYPDPEALKIIQDKGRQKAFYEDNNLPTSNFQLIESKNELLQLIQEKKINFPFVQKSCRAGYDGRGVHIVKNENDLNHLLHGECVIEDVIEIEKELAVIVARDSAGNTKCYPPVEMQFHPTANLMEFLFSPADVSEPIYKQAQKIAIDCITAFNITGILAVELFLTKGGEILINEVAPRPHNSGHHTIESIFTSQYEQLLRILFQLPLGSTRKRSDAVMINILGDENYTGEAKYSGLKECLKTEGVYVHLYNKKITKPFRKMGHVTIIHNDINNAKAKAAFIKQTLKVIA